MSEHESGSGDISDLAGAGSDVLQESPPLGQQREPTLAQTVHTPLESVQGAVVQGQWRPLTWLLNGGDDAVAGRRWRVEESFAQGKGLAGLDEHQVLTWTSWQRWSLLAMVAYAFVSVCRLSELRRHPVPEWLVVLTCNEIVRLLNALFPSVPDVEHVLAWSVFRRSHQARARSCHYRRQAARES